MLKIAYPKDNDFFQRSDSQTTKIKIYGRFRFKRKFIVSGRYRKSGIQDSWSNWQFITPELSSGTFYGALAIKDTGNFDVELRFMKKETEVDRKIIRNIHIGEIFITCGQSNSANSGETRTQTITKEVYSYTGKKWQLSKDPQPLATNDGGSPWPSMGDELYKALKVPIGIIAVGVGGSAVHEWLPGAKNFKNLILALKAGHIYGFRAVLWHQGESDAVNSTKMDIYAERLTTVISSSQDYANKHVQWIIAIAAFVPDASEPQIKQITLAQKAVCANEFALEGPTTEDLLGEKWRHDNLHFNERGLKEHGRRWAKNVIENLNLN